MDSKYFVSLKVARLLEEKGYDIRHDYVYAPDGRIISLKMLSNWSNDYLSAPTKAEVIDWLESKGIVVEVQYRRITGKYFSEIHYNKMRYKSRPSDLTEDYKTRLEAEEAAIINACKLLENGN